MLYTETPSSPCVLVLVSKDYVSHCPRLTASGIVQTCKSAMRVSQTV